MSHRYPKTYECPACEYDIEVPRDLIAGKPDECICHGCDGEFSIDWDADCEDGIWTDKTKLHPLKNT